MRITKILPISTCILFLFVSHALPQDTTKSLAFKNNKPQRRPHLLYQPDLSYRIWQQFNLIKEANAGDVLAQHELGIRYITGEGVKADTVLGAQWIKKAADKELTAAEFNYGILLINGWGVEWNPFEAFNYFLSAAKDGMPEAQNVVGSIYTDNLIVKKDWNTAYAWVKKAYDAGYEPAKSLLENLAGKADTAKVDIAAVTGSSKPITDSSSSNSSNSGSIASSLGLVFIDFDVVSDTTVKIEDESLLEALTHLEDDKINKMIYTRSGSDSTLSFDSLDIPLLLQYADNGSPEALTLLAKLYENGMFFKRDIITAAAYYIRAIRLDSPTAPFLLYEMLKVNDISVKLKSETDKKNAEAMYAWHGLVSLGIDNRITDADAFNLLNQSASLGYLPAYVELGLSYYSGKMTDADKTKAISVWKEAERLGSKEATVRIETAEIFNNGNSSSDKYSFEELLKAAENGSLLAMVTLAYCYQEGKGTPVNKAEAVKNFRYAAQRGSQYAYEELKKIYNSIRPDDEKFQIN